MSTHRAARRARCCCAAAAAATPRRLAAAAAAALAQRRPANLGPLARREEWRRQVRHEPRSIIIPMASAAAEVQRVSDGRGGDGGANRVARDVGAAIGIDEDRPRPPPRIACRGLLRPLSPPPWRGEWLRAPPGGRWAAAARFLDRPRESVEAEEMCGSRWIPPPLRRSDSGRAVSSPSRWRDRTGNCELRRLISDCCRCGTSCARCWRCSEAAATTARFPTGSSSRFTCDMGSATGSLTSAYSIVATDTAV